MKPIKWIVSLAVASLLTLQARAEPIQLRLAESWGEGTPVFGETTRRFADLVERLSSGRLTVRVDSADAHGQPLGVFDLVRRGDYELGHSASYYWKDKVPNTLYFSTMPFGMIAVEQYAWFYQGDGMALMDEVYRAHNLYSFPGGNTGVQMGGWFRSEIRSLDDVRGLRMRVPGFAGEVWSELGVETVNLPNTQLFEALKSGELDALEWVGPSLDLDMGFHTIAPYYYTGWHEPGTELQFLVHRPTFDALPGDLQQVLTVAMRTVAYDMWIMSHHRSAVNWRQMATDYPDIQVRRFPPEVLAALRGANDRLLRERAAADPLAARIIDSLADYQHKTRRWIDISERAYLGNMDAQGNRVE